MKEDIVKIQSICNASENQREPSWRRRHMTRWEEKPTLAQGSEISLLELSSSKLFPTIPEGQAGVGGDRNLF